MGLANSGVNVVLAGRRKENTLANTENIREAGGEASYALMDALKRDNISETCGFVLSRYGSIDILINAAGGNVPGATIGWENLILIRKTEFNCCPSGLTLVTLSPEFWADTKAGIIKQKRNINDFLKRLLDFINTPVFYRIKKEAYASFSFLVMIMISARRSNKKL